jgi:hypothetical protein
VKSALLLTLEEYGAVRRALRKPEAPPPLTSDSPDVWYACGYYWFVVGTPIDHSEYEVVEIPEMVRRIIAEGRQILAKPL